MFRFLASLFGRGDDDKDDWKPDNMDIMDALGRLTVEGYSPMFEVGDDGKINMRLYDSKNRQLRADEIEEVVRNELGEEWLDHIDLD